jgi:hypothetical protein
MDTVLSTADTYQVDALSGQVSLAECSVIAAGDPIRPYFVNPVVNDPDLLGLVLYIEDADGKILGRRMFYTTDDGLSRKGPAEPAAAGVLDEDLSLDEDLLKEEDQEKGRESAEPAAVFPDEDIKIPVKNFTGRLPPFPLPEDLKIGAYSLVFEIQGEYTMLSRTSQPFYYIGDRKFTVGEIRHYLPGFYGNSHLVPPGLTVMLETQVDYGEELDPYIIWYNGKNRIGGGFVAAGAARLLWEAPLRSGFHTIRAELFPFEPETGQKGKITAFSLPVSQKNEVIPGPKADDYLYWYRFTGDLLDAKTGKSLNAVRGNGPSPSWYPAEQVYGLALAGEDSYEIPGCSLDFPENGEGTLGFFIRVLPLKNSRILSARLGSSLGIDLFLEDGVLVLDVQEQGPLARTSKTLPGSGRSPVFAGVFITVKFEERRVKALLKLGDSPSTGPDGTESPWPGMESGEKDLFSLTDMPIREGDTPSEWAEIELTLPLRGELRTWIGGEPEKFPKSETPKAERKDETREESPVSSPLVSLEKPAVQPPPPPVLVIDDFAARFQAAPDRGQDIIALGDENLQDLAPEHALDGALDIGNTPGTAPGVPGNTPGNALSNAPDNKKESPEETGAEDADGEDTGDDAADEPELDDKALTPPLPRHVKNEP